MKDLLTQVQAVRIIKNAQKKSGLKDPDFADKLGVSKQYLRAVKLGLIAPSDKIGFKKIVFFEAGKKWLLQANGAR